MHVSTSPRRGNADNNILLASECFYLPRKQGVEPHIVGAGGKRRSIGGQRQGRDCSTVGLIADREFGGDMLGFGRTAPVSEQKHLAALPNAFFDYLQYSSERYRDVTMDVFENPAMLVQFDLEEILDTKR